MADSSKPKILILGGVGFIGRNLVKYIVENDFASFIRVVDKVIPSTAYLGDFQPVFDNPIVEYKQGNLTSPSSIERIFTIEGGKFNIVFNLAAETKYGQTPEVYKEKVLDLSIKCATEAVKQHVDRFVEMSTAQVYKAGKKPSKEDDKLKPWTNIAVYKQQAEDALRAMEGLPLVIVRPAVVYGPGDVLGISPRIITGAVYKHLKEKMKFLWTADLRINTVHVRDVCRALWTISSRAPLGSVWNLADKNDTSQQKINKLLEEIFGIKTGFIGGMVSQVAKMNLKSITEDVNDKHLKPWSELCRAAEIVNTPLTPYIDQELLYKNSLCIDGSAVESLGFSYEYPTVTVDLIREQIDYFVKQHLFPPF